MDATEAGTFALDCTGVFEAGGARVGIFWLD